MQNTNKIHSLLIAVGCFALVILLTAIAAHSGTEIDSNGNTVHTVKVGAMDQIQIAEGRGYLSAKCGELPEACSKSLSKAVTDGICTPDDLPDECQVKMDVRPLPTSSYKKTGVDFGICIQSDSRGECNAKMEARAVNRSRRLKYKSINPNEVPDDLENGGKNYEFCMSSTVQDDGSTVYGSLSDEDCFKKTVTAGLWPHPRRERIPRLNPAGKWSQYASRINDGVFRNNTRKAWKLDVAEVSGTSGKDPDDLEEPTIDELDGGG